MTAAATPTPPRRGDRVRAGLQGRLRPPARAHRVLDAGRGRAAEGHVRRVRAGGHVGRGHDRPRQRLRRLRLLVQGDQGRDQADHRHRGLRRPRAPPAPAAGALGHPGPEGRRRVRRRRLHPHDAARRDHRGHAQPVPAVLAGLAGGLFPQAADGPRTAGRARPGDHRHHRLPVRRGADPAAARPVPAGARGGRRLPRHLRPGQLLRRDHGPRPEHRAAGPGRPAPHRRRAGAAVRGHQRLALHGRGGRQRARGAALRADRVHHGRPGPVPVRRHRLLPEEPAGDARRVHRRGVAGRLRLHPADRRAGGRRLRRRT